MAGYTLKINGVVHQVKFVGGKKVVDPPLPEDSSGKLEKMLDAQEAPRCMTDDVFLGGMGTLADQFEGDEAGLQRVISNARKGGYNPSMNDVYMANMATHEGDPRAFVKGRADVQNRCRELGVPSEGACPVSESEVPARPERRRNVKLGEDIIQRSMAAEIAQNPDQAHNKELRDQVIDKHGNHSQADE